MRQQHSLCGKKKKNQNKSACVWMCAHRGKTERQKNNLNKNWACLLWLFFFPSGFFFSPSEDPAADAASFYTTAPGEMHMSQHIWEIDIGGLMKWLKQGVRAATAPLWCDSSSGSGFSKVIITLLITLCHRVFSSSTDVAAPTDTSAGLQALPAYCSTLLGERRRFGTVSSAALPNFIRGCDDQQTFMWRTAWHLYQRS